MSARALGRRVSAVLLLLANLAPAALWAGGASSYDARAVSVLRFDQHPGAALPLAAHFRDAAGHPVRLAAFFHGAPVVLVLDYLRCTSLCGVVLADTARALARTSLVPGRDYEVVAISIDPRDGMAREGRAREGMSNDGMVHAGTLSARPGWHALTGSGEEIRRVATAVGFHYRYDPAIDQYAHPAGITIATGQGRIARYLLGVAYRPIDLRLALAEADRGRISAVVPDLLLLCYCYDPATGRYGFTIRTITRVLCVGTALALVVLLLRLQRAPRRRAHLRDPAPAGRSSGS